jgi:DNA-binding transcriptional LysR family regulator
MSVADRLGTGTSFNEARRSRSARGRAKAIAQGDVPTYELVGALSDKRVDALIARAPLPFAADDVFTTPLYEEPRMLAVPRGHPLADRASVTAEELAGEEAAPCAFETADWTSYRILGARRAADRELRGQARTRREWQGDRRTTGRRSA